VNLLAAKAGPGAETGTGLHNKSAVAFEKHHIRLRMAAGAWRDYHGSIHARLRRPFVHSCTADAAVQEDLRCGALPFLNTHAHLRGWKARSEHG
jgi:hypothetical protein